MQEIPEREDLSMYANKETLLNGIRQQRLERQRELVDNENNGRAAALDPNTGRAASVSDIIHRAATTAGSRTSQSVYGTDGGVENGERGDNGLGEQFRVESESAPGGNGSTYQSQRTRTKRRYSIKDIAGQYKQAFTSGRQAPTTEPASKERATSAGRKLSDVEAARLRPKLIEYILWQSEHLDQLIIATTAGHGEVEIWSTIDKNDAEIIADFMLIRGRQDARAATAVRYLSVFIDRLKLGLIILPRMYQTAMVYFARGFSIR